MLEINTTISKAFIRYKTDQRRKMKRKELLDDNHDTDIELSGKDDKDFKKS